MFEVVKSGKTMHGLRKFTIATLRLCPFLMLFHIFLHLKVNEGVREKENSDRLEWLQQHVIFEGLEEKITFNSLTNCLGPRKFLHHGVLTKVHTLSLRFRT